MLLTSKRSNGKSSVKIELVLSKNSNRVRQESGREWVQGEKGGGQSVQAGRVYRLADSAGRQIVQSTGRQIVQSAGRQIVQAGR